MSNERDRYIRWAASIAPSQSRMARYDRVLFALLSVRTSFPVTGNAYRRLRGRLWFAPSDVLDAVPIGQHCRPNYSRQLARAIVSVSRDVATGVADTYLYQHGRSYQDWRGAVRANVPHLGLAKSSFAVCLLDPLRADVCCIDTHIYRWCRQQIPSLPDRSYPVTDTLYRECEYLVALTAIECGWPTFLWQWYLWDSVRGTRTSHSVLTADAVRQGTLIRE